MDGPQGRCWCETETGYVWGLQVNSEGRVIMPQNCPTRGLQDFNKPALTKEEMDKLACGDGAMQAHKDTCKPNSKNILDVTCDMDQQLGRNCCCNDGWEPMMVGEGKRLECQKREDVSTIFGRVWMEDPAEKYPFGGVKRVLVQLFYKGDKQVTHADDGGNYKFYIPLTKDTNAEIKVYLVDRIGDQVYIRILDEQVDLVEAVYMKQNVEIKSKDIEDGKEVNFIIKKDNPVPDEWETNTDKNKVPMFVKHYMHFEDAVDFALDVLKADVRQVDCVMNTKNISRRCDGPAGGCHSPNEGRIYLPEDRMPFGAKYSPETEWHEYGHRIMYSQFNVNYPTGSKNHAGFLNPSTHDSLNEAEAEFMALMIRNYMKTWHPAFFKTKSSVFRTRNFEGNPKPWMHLYGKQYEEDSISSLFWDILDSGKDRMDDPYIFVLPDPIHDEFQITLEELWDLLKQPTTQTLYDLYDVLQAKYPTQKRNIDAIFLGHGFFRDKDMGDGNYSGQNSFHYVTDEGELKSVYFIGEPFKDTNKNNQWDAGEFYIDMGKGHEFPGYMVYDKGMDDKGTVSDGGRLARRTYVEVPGSNIRIPGAENSEFLISVTYKDTPELDYSYTTTSQGDLLYIEFPPGYDAEISIEPNPDEYKGEPRKTITFNDYMEQMEASDQEYFVEQEFDLKKHRTNPFSNLFNNLGDMFNHDKGGKLGEIIGTILQVGILVFVIFLFSFIGKKRRKKKEQKHSKEKKRSKKK